jgi:hypothetical protein
MTHHQCDHCGARVYFQNSQCMACGSRLLFDPRIWRMVSVDADPTTQAWRRRSDSELIQPCAWHAQGVCNWACCTEQDTLCLSCQTTEVHPDPQASEVLTQWASAELAKRRLLFNLRHRGLPVWRHDGIEPMRFHMLSPRQGDGCVITGHDHGVISLNLEEADPVHRTIEQARFAEPYRTLLGHLRHESGHFYWDALVKPSADRLDRVRAVFGDDTLDYGQALQAHHAEVAAQGVSSGAPVGFISRYAAVHPLEDWAETWSHYLMMLDALEIQEPEIWTEVLNHRLTLDVVVERWKDLTLQLNDMNRALGLPDPYPFVFDAGVLAKLACIHQVVLDSAVSR